MIDKAAILIVDDRPDKVLALEAVLEDLGQDVVRAYSGREALRQVLARDFAVILLDVNMPDMDGFETAGLIRRRGRSEGTPIIFVTAFADEVQTVRGYRLGAVDYIMAPVVPEILRTKVSVFVDLYAKTEQVRRQAESLRRRAGQLQSLAAASVAINAAPSVDKLLQTTTDTARDIVGAHQAITLFLPRPAAAGRPGKTRSFGSFSDRYADWRGRDLRLDAIATTRVARSRTATRMTEAELRDHPDWEVVRGADLPPVRGGMLAAPLVARDGTGLGVVYLSDRADGPFTDDDEAILTQLAQTASVAVENSLYAEEREANRMKDEFLATLSHELRTPLNAILGWTQLLRLQPDPDPAEVAHGLEVIERNARSQTKLIEDLLDVSRIVTGKMRLAGRPVEVGPVVEAAVDVVRPTVEAKRIDLACHVAPAAAAARVFADPDRLQQVFWNLLTNAAKFTPPGGRIEARVERADDDGAADGGKGGPAVRVAVTDSGRGIDRQFLPHVFDRFRQADSSSTRSHGGLGIGLAIVRHIVELHGGTVRADSGGEGHGATFTVTLPLAAAAPAGSNGSNGHRPADGDDDGGGPADPWPADAAALAGLRVLLVDDEPDGREVVRQMLTRHGAEVVTAASAAAAMDLLRAHRPDLILSDVAMPDEDGHSFVRRVRMLAPDAGGATPAVALSAYSRDEDRRRALAAGFQGHLAKPVDPAALVAALVPWVPAAGAAERVTEG